MPCFLRVLSYPNRYAVKVYLELHVPLQVGKDSRPHLRFVIDSHSDAHFHQDLEGIAIHDVLSILGCPQQSVLHSFW